MTTSQNIAYWMIMGPLIAVIFVTFYFSAIHNLGVKAKVISALIALWFAVAIYLAGK